MPNLYEAEVEGVLSENGHRILAWLADPANRLDHVAAERSPEPYRNYEDQACRALGIVYLDDDNEYLGYAVQAILEDRCAYDRTLD